MIDSNNKKPVPGSQEGFSDPKQAYLFTLNSDRDLIYKALVENAWDGALAMCAFIQRLKIPEGEQYNVIRHIQEKRTPDRVNLSTETPSSARNGGIASAEIWRIWRN
jgi:hypothetical protein